jgi:hypothetical protein
MTIDERASRLQAAGWSVGEARFQTDEPLVWRMDGINRENQLIARAPTQTGAWRAACTDAFAKEASDSTWSAPVAVLLQAVSKRHFGSRL